MKDIGKYIREATVRRDVVVRLILMLKDSGHIDYQHLSRRNVEERARLLTRREGEEELGGMEAVIPECIVHFFDDDEDRVDDLETDKAAAPAERGKAPEYVFEARRLNPVVLQRNPDAKKCVDAARSAALEKNAGLDVKIGSTLLPQIEGD